MPVSTCTAVGTGLRAVVGAPPGNAIGVTVGDGGETFIGFSSADGGACSLLAAAMPPDGATNPTSVSLTDRDDGGFTEVLSTSSTMDAGATFALADFDWQGRLATDAGYAVLTIASALALSKQPVLVTPIGRASRSGNKIYLPIALGDDPAIFSEVGLVRFVYNER